MKECRNGGGVVRRERVRERGKDTREKERGRERGERQTDRDRQIETDRQPGSSKNLPTHILL